MHYKTPEGTAHIDLHVWQPCSHLFRSFHKSKYNWGVRGMTHWSLTWWMTCINTIFFYLLPVFSKQTQRLKCVLLSLQARNCLSLLRRPNLCNWRVRWQHLLQLRGEIWHRMWSVEYSGTNDYSPWRSWLCGSSGKLYGTLLIGLHCITSLTK